MSTPSSGYQQTELGVIPNDWQTPTIQDLLERGVVVGHLDGNHGELYPRSHEFKESGVPYITANDLCGHKVSFAKCKYLSEERARQFRKGVAQNGDVLFAHNATVGPTALLSTELDYVILSTTATYFRCNPEQLVNSFLLYALQSSPFVGQYRAVMAQSTRNQVPITAQRKLALILPPTKAEQEAIAEALSDTDSLIESLEQLLAKKCQLKHGTMQELLTGKKRLPGFQVNTGYKKSEVGVIPMDWNVKLLPDVCKFRGGKAHEQYVSEFGEYICVNSKFISTEGLVKKHTTANFCCANKNDVLMVMSDLPNGKALAKAYLTDRDNYYAVNQRVCALTAYYDCPKYLFYILNRNSYFLKFDNGVSQTHLLNNVFAACPIPLPPTKVEQEQIAAALSDIDAEIADLEVQLKKTRALKQGMMQKLLTGEIRLL